MSRRHSQFRERLIGETFFSENNLLSQDTILALYSMAKVNTANLGSKISLKGLSSEKAGNWLWIRMTQRVSDIKEY